MGLLKKFINIFRGKAYRLADTLENNVESVDLKIRDMQSQVVKITQALAPVLGSIDRLEFKKGKLEDELKDITKNLDKAIDKGEDASATKYLSERKVKLKEIAELESVLNQNKATAATSKQTLEELNRQVDDLKRYRASVKLRSQTAVATTELNKLLLESGANINSDGHLQLDQIEDKIEEQEDTANGLQKLVGDNLKVIDVNYEEDLTAELEEYKRSRGSKDE